MRREELQLRIPIRESFDDPQMHGMSQIYDVLRQIPNIDLKSAKVERVTDITSNRDPRLKYTLSIYTHRYSRDTYGLNDNRLIVFKDMGYDTNWNGDKIYRNDMYILGASYGSYTSISTEACEFLGTRRIPFDDLSNTKLISLTKARIFETYLLTFKTKSAKDHYKDPRNFDDGIYAGQIRNKYYDPNSEYASHRDQYIIQGNSRVGHRDKSGYQIRKIDDMIAQLYKKYKSGDIDSDLYNRFKLVSDRLKKTIERYKAISIYIPEYNVNNTEKSVRPLRDRINKIDRIGRYLNSAIDDYTGLMSNINSDREWDSTFSVSGYLSSFKRISETIDEVDSMLDNIQ